MLRFLRLGLCAGCLLVGCHASTGTASECGDLCTVLANVGCNPAPSCSDTCNAAISQQLVTPAQIACVRGSTNKAGVQACGGGFCR